MISLSEFQNIKNKFTQLQGRRNLLIEQKESAEIKKTNAEKLLDNSLKARAIVQTVAEQTQKKLEFHVSNLVSMALSSVFPDPYTFELRYIQRRNKTEADLIFSKNGKETDDILNTGGGGVADIASLALRISLWSIKKTRPVLILDESTKFLHSPIYQEKASELLKEVCNKMGLQIIMISDQPDILKFANNIIRVKNINGKSIINDLGIKVEKISKLKRRNSLK